MNSRKFEVVSLSIPAAGLPIPGECTDLTFINYGNEASPPVGAVLVVDDVVRVHAGQQYIIAAASAEEFDTTKHRVYWDTSVSNITRGVVLRKVMKS